MKIGNKTFENHTYIMGILNVTPDSFTDGGYYNSVDKALYRVKDMLKEGADIIDVGGESTRPGFERISDREEIYRVSPIIEAIKENFDCIISIDTYKSSVAKAAVDAGADMINDIWGFKYDKNMAKIAADMKLPCCIMHNRDNKEYEGNFMDCVIEDLRESLQIAQRAGVPKSNIIVDPGVGFAKSYEQNLIVMKNLGRLKELGCPIMLAASKKSVIGNALGLNTHERGEGTLATTALAVMNGAVLVRVHDIEPNRRVIKMLETILNS